MKEIISIPIAFKTIQAHRNLDKSFSSKTSYFGSYAKMSIYSVKLILGSELVVIFKNI